jgi:hypothetical protein
VTEPDHEAHGRPLANRAQLDDTKGTAGAKCAPNGARALAIAGIDRAALLARARQSE